MKDSTLPYVDVEVKEVVLDDLRQSPYSARIEFEKVFTNPADHTELKRERWTASVTYVFRESVKNNELAVNPLGLTIVRFRADQAFNEGIVDFSKESRCPDWLPIRLLRPLWLYGLFHGASRAAVRGPPSVASRSRPDKTARMDLRLPRTAAAKPPKRTMIPFASPLCLPPFAWSLLRAYSGARRHCAALLRLRSPSGHGSSLKGPLQESATWHLGAGPIR